MTENQKTHTQVARYKENPFVQDMDVPVANKSIRVGRLGRDEHILVNSATGEVQGTHVVTYKRVDAEQFVKLFTANIALTFELKAAGIKALSVLMWAVQGKSQAKDLVPLDKYILDDFLAAHGDRNPPLKLSPPTFLRGLPSPNWPSSTRQPSSWPSWRPQKSLQKTFDLAGTLSIQTLCLMGIASPLPLWWNGSVRRPEILIPSI